MNIIRKTINGPITATMRPSIQGPAISRWGNWRIWLNLCLLFLTLGTAVYSIEQARWMYPQPYLTLVLFLSIISTWLMTVYRLPKWFLHPAAITIGFLVILWQGTMILPGGGGIGNLFSVISSWWQGRAMLQGGNAKIIFGMFLVLIAWLAGYLSTWIILRFHNAWPAVLLGLVIILLNLTNLPSINYVFFIIFLVAAAALIVQTNAVRQQISTKNQTNYSGKSLMRLTIPLTGIIIVSVLVAWITPQLRFPGFQDNVASSLPWQNSWQKSGLNFFNAIPPKLALNSTGGLPDLTFSPNWNSGEDILYTIKSPQPAYWQVNVYDKYTSKQWESTLDTEKSLGKNINWDGSGNGAGQTALKYQVTPMISTDIVLIAGKFVSAEIPVTVHYGLENEVLGVNSVRIIGSNEKYTVNSYLSDYSAETLNAAGENYPKSVTFTYLQLPNSLPSEIRELSGNLTVFSQTPYEKLLVINQYLSGFPYTLAMSPIPEGEDPVDNFLFIQKTGSCLYFASAMTVMLRSVGVPARLVVGYVPGDPGPDKDTYIIRDKHYHAWTQVYFPGYGWLDFDPTPGGPSNANSTTPSAPLVSPSHLREWDYWGLYPGILPPYGGNTSLISGQNRNPTNGELPFAKALGVIILIVIIGASLFVLAYIILRMVRPFYRRNIWNVDRDNPAASAFANLRRLAINNGMALNPWQTPQEVSSQIAEAIPEQTENLEFLVRAYQNKRFGPEKGKPSLYEEAEILKARILVNNAIIEKKGRLQRFMLGS